MIFLADIAHAPNYYRELVCRVFLFFSPPSPPFSFYTRDCSRASHATRAPTSSVREFTMHRDRLIQFERAVVDSLLLFLFVCLDVRMKQSIVCL